MIWKWVRFRRRDRGNMVLVLINNSQNLQDGPLQGHLNSLHDLVLLWVQVVSRLFHGVINDDSFLPGPLTSIGLGRR